MNKSIEQMEQELSVAVDVRERIGLLNGFAWELRDVDSARSRNFADTAYERSTTGQFGEHAYVPGLAASLRTLSVANRREGNLKLALEQALRALACLAGESDAGLKVDILQAIGIAYSNLGNHAGALEHCLQALELAREIDNREREASVLGAVATSQNRAGDSQQAVTTFLEVLALNRELGQKTGEALTLNNLAMSYHSVGNHTDALPMSLQGLELAKACGFAALVVTATGTVGEIYLAVGDYAQASRYLRQYLLLASDSASRLNEMWALLLLAETSYAQQAFSDALTLVLQALTLAQELGTLVEQARCHRMMVELYEGQGDLRQALEHSKSLNEVEEVLFNEGTAKRVAYLQLVHQIENAERDAEIHELRSIELQREIEERKKVQSALETLATTDPLTGLLNRREFYALGEAAIARASRDGLGLAAILVDLDHFKSINDTFGHAVGDQMLVGVARTILANVRTGDIVCRFGGDEFAILLPGGDARSTQEIARRLGHNLARMELETEHGTAHITGSLGIAALQPNDGSVDALLDHADRAMYNSKKSGRNRTHTYGAG
jgi:diguanylate cyclase (GGDEF)-like protein